MAVWYHRGISTESGYDLISADDQCGLERCAWFVYAPPARLLGHAVGKHHADADREWGPGLHFECFYGRIECGHSDQVLRLWRFEHAGGRSIVLIECVHEPDCG